jgi:hypothetical protein
MPAYEMFGDVPPIVIDTRSAMRLRSSPATYFDKLTRHFRYSDVNSQLACWQQGGSQVAATYRRPLSPARDDLQNRVSPDIWACLADSSEPSTSHSGRGKIAHSLDPLQLAHVQGHETGSG